MAIFLKSPIENELVEIIDVLDNHELIVQIKRDGFVTVVKMVELRASGGTREIGQRIEEIMEKKQDRKNDESD